MSETKKRIKRFVKKHDFLFAMVNLVRNRKNKSFLKMCVDSSMNVRINPSQGNIGKPAICYIDDRLYCGLFWYLRLVLEAVYFCDNMGFVPQILWSKSIYQDEKIEKTSNPFEYYFCQPYPMTEEELKIRPVITYSPGNQGLARDMIGDDESIYAGNNQYINSLASIAKIALQYNSETRGVIETFIETHRINDDTLGIHARGTDFRKKHDYHPVFIETEEYYEYIDFALREFGFSKIYLATDDQNILNGFLSHYPQIEIIYSKDVHRGEGDEGIHTKAYEDSAYSPFKEGLNALCDMAALARCGGLISGVSNLPLIARVVSESEKRNYKYDKVIDKGLYGRGINPAKLNFTRSK